MAFVALYSAGLGVWGGGCRSGGEKAAGEVWRGLMAMAAKKQRQKTD